MKVLKKTLAVLVTVLLVISFGACGKKTGTDTSSDKTDTPQDAVPSVTEPDTLPGDLDPGDGPSYNGAAFEKSKAYQSEPTAANLCEIDGYSYKIYYYKAEDAGYTLITRTDGTYTQKLYVLKGMWYVGYIQNSYEASAEHLIYVDSQSETYYYEGNSAALYAIEPESGRIDVLYDGSVSNLVIPESPVVGYENRGWVATTNALIPIDLTTGNALVSETFYLSSGEYPEISGTFFDYPSAGYNVKNTFLENYDNAIILVTVSQYSTEDEDLPSTVVQYYFDYASSALTKVE